MTRAMQPMRRVGRAFERYEREVAGMGGWTIAKIVAGVLVALLVAVNAKDVVRYIKISTM
jgi:hypothetical protein